MNSIKNDLAKLQETVLYTLLQSTTLSEVCNLLIIAHGSWTILLI